MKNFLNTIQILPNKSNNQGNTKKENKPGKAKSHMCTLI